METTDASGTSVYPPSSDIDPVFLAPPPPDVLTLADLLNDQTVIVSKEQADKELLDAIGTQRVENFRAKLLDWVLKGRPTFFPLYEANIYPPPKCSDGQTRGLADYIQYCSGKTIEEHTALLQAKLPDIPITFANVRGIVTIVTI